MSRASGHEARSRATSRIASITANVTSCVADDRERRRAGVGSASCGSARVVEHRRARPTERRREEDPGGEAGEQVERSSASESTPRLPEHREDERGRRAISSERVRERPERRRAPSPCTSPGGRAGRGSRTARGSGQVGVDASRRAQSRSGGHPRDQTSRLTARARLQRRERGSRRSLAFPGRGRRPLGAAPLAVARRLVAAPREDRWHERATPSRRDRHLRRPHRRLWLAVAAGAVAASSRAARRSSAAARCSSSPGSSTTSARCRPLAKLAAQFAAAAIVLATGLRSRSSATTCSRPRSRSSGSSG